MSIVEKRGEGVALPRRRMPPCNGRISPVFLRRENPPIKSDALLQPSFTIFIFRHSGRCGFPAQYTIQDQSSIPE